LSRFNSGHRRENVEQMVCQTLANFPDIVPREFVETLEKSVVSV
jgi:hypothetical protein